MPGFRKTLHEYKEGTLHSGKGGPRVTNRQQALAIAFSQARKVGERPSYAGLKRAAR